MAGYVGSELQIKRARQSDDHFHKTLTTHAACNNGHMLACDDVSAIGWDRIWDAMATDGAFGFRLLSNADGEIVASQMRARGYRFDVWDTFTAERSAALPRVREIVAKNLPEGLSRVELGNDPEAEIVRRIQEFMLANDVVPFSGSMLVGALAPARTIAIADDADNIVATAHTYMPHNATSPNHHKAWGGLVAVSPSQRGRGLGLYVNAAIAKAAFEDLKADAIYEMVSSTNEPSRRMVEACGLKHDPGITSGAATSDAGRFTK
jgi:hypothetical protein